MGDRFYCQRDNLTLSLQPDRRTKFSETPTDFKTKQPPMYPISGKVYQFNGVEKIWTGKWETVTPIEFPKNPKLGQLFKHEETSYVFIPKKGWIAVSELSFL